jgi:hypothetical protein
MRRVTLAAFCALAIAALGACDSETSDPPVCVEVAGACSPLYEPTFENVYNETLSKKCSVANAACHSGAAAKGGLSLEGIDEAYDGLVNSNPPRVLVDDPGCSVLAIRIESENPSYVMPIGARMSDPERCAILQWIQDGAQR